MNLLPHMKIAGLIAGLALVLTACGSGNIGENGLDVTGTWSGTATTEGCTDCPVTFDLDQDGSTVTGTSTDPTNDSTIDVSGTLSGNDLTLTHDSGSGNSIVHEGEVSADGDAITGTIEGVNDTGTTLSGTFSVTRD